MHDKGYTQREWDRTVGWGKVPDEYNRVPLVIQMERILREATRIEKRTKELLKKVKSMR